METNFTLKNCSYIEFKTLKNSFRYMHIYQGLTIEKCYSASEFLLFNDNDIAILENISFFHCYSKSMLLKLKRAQNISLINFTIYNFTHPEFPKIDVDFLISIQK